MKKDQLEQLLELLETNPNDPFLNFAIAQEYAKKGDLEQALERYKKLVDSDPEYTGTYYHLGKLYEQLGEVDLAIETYRKGIAVTKKLGQIHDKDELLTALSTIKD